MKPVHQHLLVAACLAVLGATASAQPAPPAPPAVAAPGPAAVAPGATAGLPMRRAHAEHMQQQRAQREAALKQILQITPAQEAAWNTWIASRHARPAFAGAQRGELAQLTTPQRIDRMRELRAARNAEMDRRGEATKAFYAALSPAQQKAFDALTASRGLRRGDHRGGWGHHHFG